MSTYSYVKFVEVLMLYDANPDAPSDFFRSSLGLVVMLNHDRIVQKLQAYGAKQKGSIGDGVSQLISATSMKNRYVFQLLLDKNLKFVNKQAIRLAINLYQHGLLPMFKEFGVDFS